MATADDTKEKGHSEHTPHKQMKLVHIFNSLLQVADPNKPFHYADLHAGEGRPEIEVKKKHKKVVTIKNLGTCPGSPILAHYILGSIPKYESYLFEMHGKTFAKLEKIMDEFQDSRNHLHCTDNDRAPKLLKSLCGNDPGLVYYDPTTSCKFGLVLDVAKACPNMDILCYVNAVQLKRNLGKRLAGQDVDDDIMIQLRDYVEELGKDRTFISQPRGKQQWVLVMSTNNKNYNPPSCMSDISKTDGKAIFNFVCNPKIDDDEEEDDTAEVMAFLNDTDSWKIS